MSFETITMTSRLESFIDPQLALIDEAKWHVEDDRLYSRAVDAGGVAMYEVTLDRTAMESYTADGETLGMNVTKLEDYVTSKVAGELVHLFIDPETRKLTVDVGPTDYTMALISPDAIRKEPDLPNLDLPAEIGIEGSMLKNALDAADMVSDHVVLTVDPAEHEFIIGAEGDTDDATTTLSDDDLLSVQTGVSATVSKFSLDYLLDMVKPIPNDAEVTLELGDEFPMTIAYDLSDGNVEVYNTLAPRIQSD